MHQGVKQDSRIPLAPKMAAWRRGSAVPSKMPSAHSIGVPNRVATAAGRAILFHPISRVGIKRLSVIIASFGNGGSIAPIPRPRSPRIRTDLCALSQLRVIVSDKLFGEIKKAIDYF
jgi:hypothetical protein